MLGRKTKKMTVISSNVTLIPINVNKLNSAFEN